MLKEKARVTDWEKPIVDLFPENTHIPPGLPHPWDPGEFYAVRSPGAVTL